MEQKLNNLLNYNPWLTSRYVIHNDLGLFDQNIHYINHSFNTYAKLPSVQPLVDGNLLTKKTALMFPFSVDS
jgi:hypothetical protein